MDTFHVAVMSYNHVWLHVGPVDITDAKHNYM